MAKTREQSVWGFCALTMRDSFRQAITNTRAKPIVAQWVHLVLEGWVFANRERPPTTKHQIRVARF